MRCETPNVSATARVGVSGFARSTSDPPQQIRRDPAPGTAPSQTGRRRGDLQPPAHILQTLRTPAVTLPSGAELRAELDQVDAENTEYETLRRRMAAIDRRRSQRAARLEEMARVESFVSAVANRSAGQVLDLRSDPTAPLPALPGFLPVADGVAAELMGGGPVSGLAAATRDLLGLTAGGKVSPETVRAAFRTCGMDPTTGYAVSGAA